MMEAYKDLFYKPTTSAFIQFMRYLIVGGMAFVADGISLYFFVMLGFHYLVAAVFGFLIGLASNYIFSKKMVFRDENTQASPLGEFLIYGLIGVIGLGMTEVIMYFCTELLGVFFMISKVVAAIIVLVWNFGARKLILYREV